MTTVFSDDLFKKSELFTTDKKNKVVCSLKDASGKYAGDLVRQDSKGFVIGRIINPSSIPEWLIPGTVLKGVVNGLPMILTMEPQIQSRVQGTSDILGDKIKFSYVVVSEFSK
jgi:hypothetical protein